MNCSALHDCLSALSTCTIVGCVQPVSSAFADPILTRWQQQQTKWFRRLPLCNKYIVLCEQTVQFSRKTSDKALSKRLGQVEGLRPRGGPPTPVSMPCPHQHPEAFEPFEVRRAPLPPLAKHRQLGVLSGANHSTGHVKRL